MFWKVHFKKQTKRQCSDKTTYFSFKLSLPSGGRWHIPFKELVLLHNCNNHNEAKVNLECFLAKSTVRHRWGGHFDAEIKQQPSQTAQQRYSKTLQKRCNNSGTTLNNCPKPGHSGLMCGKHCSNAIVYRSRTKDSAFSFDARSRLCKQAYVNLCDIFKSRNIQQIHG